MRILIVGAGPSGLVALKEMREAGFEAWAVDERATFGGVFAPDSGVTFEGLHLTISNLFMSFSDFPAYDVDQGVKFWSKSEYFDYLARYVERFDLARHLRTDTKVERAHFDHTKGTWEVAIQHLPSGTETKETFDKLIVASGANHVPHLPTVLDGFDGEVLHSAAYHSPEQVRGKRVLVVGMGEGGADVAASATRTAASVTVWGRRFPDCAPRFVKPYMEDAGYDEQDHLPGHHRPNAVLEHITISRAVRTLPLGLWSVALHGLTADMSAKHGPNSMQAIARAFVSRAWSRDYYSSDTSMVPTKSAVTLTAAARGLLDIVIAPRADVRGAGVRFTDAQVFGAGDEGAAADARCHETLDREFDVVIACTGFGLDFEWITTSDPEVRLTEDPRSWFKHCFPPGMGDYLAMVGFARPHSGGIPQCSEMVSRYIAQLHLGNRRLPADYAERALAEGAAEAACFNLTPDYRMLVDYMAYMMSVAKLVGCEPATNAPQRTAHDAVKYWTFPLWPCFFRTRGVGAKPETAEAVLRHFEPFDALAPMPLVALEVACGFAMPLVNLASLAADRLLPTRARAALPRGYRWRLSKMHFLYENSLTAHDFRGVVDQWTAASMVAGHLLTRGLKARLAGEVAVDEIPARAEPSRATKPRSREMHAAPA